jgi:hypothetical protein
MKIMDRYTHGPAGEEAEGNEKKCERNKLVLNKKKMQTLTIRGGAGIAQSV